jgi:hypothetical protein
MNKNLSDNDLEYELDMRKFLLKKYRHEIVFFIIIAVSIGLFKWFNFITTDTTGTLLGALIGYFAATIRKIHD